MIAPVAPPTAWTPNIGTRATDVSIQAVSPELGEQFITVLGSLLPRPVRMTSGL
jgi:hypothetical protein